MGLVALRWSAYYFVLCVNAVLRFAVRSEQADELAGRYTVFKRVAAAALDALTDRAGRRRAGAPNFRRQRRFRVAQRPPISTLCFA